MAQSFIQRSSIHLGIQRREVEKVDRLGNFATTNFDDIVLYDAAFAEKQNLARILVHELAHVVYLNFPESKRTSYEKDADWIRLNVGDGKTITIPKHGRMYVEKDGGYPLTKISQTI